MSELELYQIIYLWGFVSHLIGMGAHQVTSKPELTAAGQIGRALHLVAWPIMTPAVLIYIWLEEKF